MHGEDFMKQSIKTIRFKGEEYVFGADSLDESGFIATREQYENGLCSYAHYTPGLGVIRFGKKIGERADLEITGETKVDVDLHTAITNMSTPGRGGWL